MLHSLATLASEDPTATVGVSAVAGAGGASLLTWFFKRFVKQTDDTKKEQRLAIENERTANARQFADIHEDLGTLKAARDRSKEKDDEQAKLIEGLSRDLREIRDIVIVLKAKSE